MKQHQEDRVIYIARALQTCQLLCAYTGYGLSTCMQEIMNFSYLTFIHYASDKEFG